MNIVSKIADLFMPSQEVSSCDNFHLFKAEYRILETTIIKIILNGWKN